MFSALLASIFPFNALAFTHSCSTGKVVPRGKEMNQTATACIRNPRRPVLSFFLLCSLLNLEKQFRALKRRQVWLETDALVPEAEGFRMSLGVGEPLRGMDGSVGTLSWSDPVAAHPGEFREAWDTDGFDVHRPRAPHLSKLREFLQRKCDLWIKCC